MKSSFYILFVITFFTITNCTKKNKPFVEKQYLFKKLNPKKTGISFTNSIKETKTHNIIEYLYYYNGAGVSIGDINNDSLPDIYFVSNQGENKLYLNLGNLKFKDITESAGVKGNSTWNTGTTMVDINNDGYLDIYVCSVTGILDFKGHNELYINNGDGTFIDKSEEFNLNIKGYSTQAYFFDYDKDNDLDLYIVNHAVHTKASHGPAQIRKKRADQVGDVLLKNENNKFIDVSKHANIYGGVNSYGLSAAIVDFNNDGWEDIYVCNDFHEDDYFYLNNQDGTFKESFEKVFKTSSRFSMGSDAGDINNDGLFDLITLDMLPYDESVLKESEGDVNYNTQDYLISLGYKKQYSRNMLHLNNGSFFNELGNFNDISATDWSWGPLFSDFNNDGFNDVFITNGVKKRPNNLDFMKYISSSFNNRSPFDNEKKWLLESLKKMPEGKVPNQIYAGNAKKLKNKTGEWIDDIASLSNGAAYADLDNDGDLDLVINNLNEQSYVYENTSENNYINLSLNFKEKNIYGIGSKILLYKNDSLQIRNLQPSRGFMSSSDYKIHFGIGKSKAIDSVCIIWPDNSKQLFNNLEVNKTHNLAYDIKKLNHDSNYSKHPVNEYLFEETIFFKEYIHKEDSYNDFNYEKLIPYKVSTSGPAYAIGDINNDGNDDIFLGNGSGYKATLFLSDNNSYIKTSIPEIENDSLYEDNTAIFIDFDNDKDLDLYIGSGINTQKNKKYLNDRLYINDGKGNFKKSTKKVFPENFLNTKTLSAYDYDFDGDIDLFVGNRSIPNNFGKNPKSYLLKNVDGIFELEDSFSISGFITSSSWQDINNDGMKDLLISSEWEKPRVFINNHGELNELNLPDNINGLWQTITLYDIDNDNDKDILLGNWGLNNRFNVNKQDQLVMYYSDFDNNGKSEAIITHSINNKDYPIYTKDEIDSQLPYLKKKYPLYSQYAGKVFEDIFSDNQANNSLINKVHTLASGYIKNEKGTFNKFIPFNDKLQQGLISSIIVNDFNNDGNNEALITGNFHDLNTFHGIFNNLDPTIINNKGEITQHIKPINKSLFNKQTRNGIVIKSNEKKILLMLNNNDYLDAFIIK